MLAIWYGGIFIKYHQTLLLFSFTTILMLAACAGNDNGADNESLENSNAEMKDTETENTSQKKDLDGTLWGEDGNIGVVLSHGAAYDADSWEKQGAQLAVEGMVAFAVEDTEPDTLIEAANMLKDEHGVEKVSIIGASAGGSTAIDAINKEDFDFNRVVLLSPGGDAASIENIPVLTIYSEAEEFEDIEEAAEINDTLETVSFSGDAHAQELFQEDEKAEQVMEEIISFLTE